jgi:uncharacterized protein YbaR (Trm112 family)
MDIGKFCPKCGAKLWLMSTTNQWTLYCKPCDQRYNELLEEKPKED